MLREVITDGFADKGSWSFQQQVIVLRMHVEVGSRKVIHENHVGQGIDDREFLPFAFLQQAPQLQMGPDSGQNFPRLEGLGHIVRAAHGKSPNLVFGYGHSADEQYRNIFQLLVRLDCLDCLANLESIHLRHADIQQDQIRRTSFRGGQGLRSIGKSHHMMALLQQKLEQKLQICRIVVHDHDRGLVCTAHGCMQCISFRASLSTLFIVPTFRVGTQFRTLCVHPTTGHWRIPGFFEQIADEELSPLFSINLDSDCSHPRPDPRVVKSVDHFSQSPACPRVLLRGFPGQSTQTNNIPALRGRQDRPDRGLG